MKQQIIIDIENEFNKIKDLSGDLKKAKNEEIKWLIRYYRTMTDNIDARRSSSVTFMHQLLVVLVAALGFVCAIKSEINNLLFWFLIILILLHIIFSLYGIFIYYNQNKYRYPFLDIPEYSNKWKWFYHGNEHISKIETRIFRATSNENTTIPYLNGLKQFVKSYREETLDDEIINNIQQLYLLQVHNYYKNKFDAQLIDIRNNSLLYSFVLLVLFIFISAIQFVSEWNFLQYLEKLFN